ncbi:hypothetical protein KUTeg_024397 [Tegillarca granosa]|uniref:Uncharacterized protein n=1 Tax=Tegillarca granosa TaxID=220873 RepID=A0ABQ9E2B8_TEGGR|nr:hypothetical protein KUTeg_024397 [Tegillarca granosa]
MTAVTRLFYGAIDFGTTYSGFAFASVNELKKYGTGEKITIQTNNWNAGSFMSPKAPTCLLLDKDEKFDSFGYDAEIRYMRLADEEDITGTKSMKAIDVFSHCIRYLKDEMFKIISDRVTSIDPSDIMYVLTVPAIWDDSSKQFMRQAAVQAGIMTDQLIIALEPEAASIFCQNLPTEREIVDGKTVLKVGGEGTRYMIADLGGGTADITVHERLASGKIKEVHRADGGALGGKDVDDAFLKFLDTLLGPEVMKDFKDQCMEDYIELLREFETKKREASETKEKINMSVPVSLKDILKRGVPQWIKFDVSYTKSQKIQIKKKTFLSFYEKTVKGIAEIITKILSDLNVTTIVMVGGFSDCKLMSAELRENVIDENIQTLVIPADAELAVLKGAVLFGFMPETIFARVARKTYGIQSWPIFRDGYHPTNKKVRINGIDRCRDVFFKYVEIGQEVTAGHRMSQVFQALGGKEDHLECNIYVSSNPDPTFVTDDDCKLLGVLKMPLPKGIKDDDRVEIEETLVFGDTELHVMAREFLTGHSVKCSFDLI